MKKHIAICITLVLLISGCKSPSDHSLSDEDEAALISIHDSIKENVSNEPSSDNSEMPIIEYLDYMKGYHGLAIRLPDEIIPDQDGNYILPITVNNLAKDDLFIRADGLESVSGVLLDDTFFECFPGNLVSDFHRTKYVLLRFEPTDEEGFRESPRSAHYTKIIIGNIEKKPYISGSRFEFSLKFSGYYKKTGFYFETNELEKSIRLLPGTNTSSRAIKGSDKGGSPKAPALIGAFGPTPPRPLLFFNLASPINPSSSGVKPRRIPPVYSLSTGHVSKLWKNQKLKVPNIGTI